jgi:VanZ family protein
LRERKTIWSNKSVSDQPWRNPRPAPTLPEVQPRVASSFVPWIRVWWPALLWASFIFSMSTDAFSQDHTSRFIEPLLRWLLPHFSHRQIVHIHHIIRKCAHFTEYFIFSILLFRAIRGARRGWHWTWGITALIIAAGYACLDEIHQAFVTSRTATPWDSLIDSVGAFVAYLALFTWFHLRKSSRPTSTTDLS